MMEEEQQGGGHISDRFRSTPLPGLQLAFPSINTIQPLATFVPFCSSSSCLFFFPTLSLPTSNYSSPSSTNQHSSFSPNYFNRLNRAICLILAHHVVRGAFPHLSSFHQRENHRVVLTCVFISSGIFGYINYLVERDRQFIIDTLLNGMSPTTVLRSLKSGEPLLI
jgi:hypothetical protein